MEQVDNDDPLWVKYARAPASMCTHTDARTHASRLWIFSFEDISLLADMAIKIGHWDIFIR